MTGIAKTTGIDTATEIAEAVAELEGVTEANAWIRVPGKERIYIELKGHNGRGPGVGRIEVCLNTGQVRYSLTHAWQGARTRNWHESNDTLGRIEATVAPWFTA